jgi:hypothetical protein
LQYHSQDDDRNSNIKGWAQHFVFIVDQKSQQNAIDWLQVEAEVNGEG